MAYKVERNNATGAFECHFEHDGHKYLAVVSPVSMSGYTECTIYPVDVFDTIWGKWNVPMTEAGLLDCIEEFMRRKERHGEDCAISR